MPNIRVDEDVYGALKKRAEPFVDTPNTVLRRLLGLAAVGSSTDTTKDKSSDDRSRRRKKLPRVSGRGGVRKGRRVPAGSLLPEDEYVLPLLSVLDESGGSLPSGEAIDEVGKRLNGRLTSTDRAKLASGGIRWRSRVQFVRLRLVERGLLDRSAPRGIWALTDAGREQLRELKAEEQS